MPWAWAVSPIVSDKAEFVEEAKAYVHEAMDYG
jgi:hypothetical protein